MTKALAICPFCDDGRAFTWQGLIMHVKAKHPNKLSELKDNKKMYMMKFACDEVGNPLEASTTPEPEPTPAPEPESPAPKVTPEPTSAPEVTPPEPKKTTPKEKPAEGGGFLDTLRKAIDDLPGL